MDDEYLKVYGKCTEGGQGRAGRADGWFDWAVVAGPFTAPARAPRRTLHQLPLLSSSPPLSHLAPEAQKLAQQFSNTEFISKLLPESGVLEALKKVVPMALKLVV